MKKRQVYKRDRVASGLPSVKPMPGYAGVAAVLAICVIVTAAIWLFRKGPGTNQSQDLKRVSVIHVEGTASQPAVSPDGAKVAFVWEQPGGTVPQIWIVAVGESSPHLLTRRRGRYSSPAWSPDGNSLAYFRFDGDMGEVVIAPANGAGERTITRVFPSRKGLPFGDADWSPDGRTLAIDDTESKAQPFAIYTVSLKSGEKKQITHPGSGIIGDVHPKFSPDGKSIAFIRSSEGVRQEIFIADVGGGPVRQITSDNKQVSGYDWQPGTNSLVFASGSTGEFRLWKVSADTRDVRKATQFTDIRSDFPIQLSIAKNAAALVYSVLHQDSDIWRVDLKR